MRELLESFYSAFNEHDVEKLGEHLSSDFTQTSPYGVEISKKTLLMHLREVYSNVEDKHVEPVKWFIDGDEAAVVIESSGKHIGEFLSLQGTGKRFKITAVHLFQVDNGLIKHWKPVWNADHLKKMLTS